MHWNTEVKQERRKKSDLIEIDITNTNQPLPVHVDSFSMFSYNT